GPTNGFALQVFGRSVRESNCECDRSMEASLLQTVFLQNDSAVIQAIEQDKSSWIAQLAKTSAANESSARGSGQHDSIEAMKARRAQMKKGTSAAQLKKIEDRIAQLEKDGTDAAKAADESDLALEENEIVRQAYLRTLSRLPTADEQDRCLSYLAEAES